MTAPLYTCICGKPTDGTHWHFLGGTNWTPICETCDQARQAYRLADIAADQAYQRTISVAAPAILDKAIADESEVISW